MPSVKIVTARQVLTISTADLEVARHLGINVNAPVAEVRRVFTGTQAARDLPRPKSPTGATSSTWRST